MIQKPKSSFLYQSDILAALTATGIRQTSPGGKARAFCDIVGDKLGELETRQYINLSQTLLPFATGPSLDFLGEMYGVTRIPQSDVISPNTDSNVRFYVRTGTFGAINGGLDIVVPAGTRLSSDASTGPSYVTSEPVTLAASESQHYVGVEAVEAGASGVAPAGVLAKHNFTDYADSRFGSLLVANDLGLIGGRDQEDDDSYRYRINLRLHAQGGAGEGDIRLAVLQVPGVQDVDIERLAGSFNVYVYGISPAVPASLLQLVQEQINQQVAFPMTGTALAPDLVGISVHTTVKLSATVSAIDRSTILSAASAAAQDYINNLRIGDAVVLNEIADRIINADSRILDVGQPNRPLDQVFIWRSRLDGSRYSRYLVGNYTPVVGERIVVESMTSAIDLALA